MHVTTYVLKPLIIFHKVSINRQSQPLGYNYVYSYDILLLTFILRVPSELCDNMDMALILFGLSDIAN